METCDGVTCPIVSYQEPLKLLNFLTTFFAENHFRKEFSDVKVELLKEHSEQNSSILIFLHNSHLRISPISDETRFWQIICETKSSPLWLKIWASTCVDDVQALHELLKTGRTLPKCVFTALLRKSVERKFDKIVDILLHHCTYHQVPSDIIHRCVYRFYDFTGYANDVISLHPRETWRSEGKKIANMLVSLLGRTQNLSLDLARAVVNLTSLVALFSENQKPKLASRLLDQVTLVPVIGDDFEFSFSPIKIAMNYCLLAYYEIEDGQMDTSSEEESPPLLPLSDIARILQFSVLGLLRAGSRCDRFHHLKLLPLFLRWSQSGQADSWRLWRQHEVILKIVVEALSPSTTIPTVADMKFSLRRRLSDSDVDFLEAVRKQFPRSLQHLCRQTVCRHLPVGPSRRLKAIRQLDLPDLLEKFLNFDELDLRPESLLTKTPETAVLSSKNQISDAMEN